MKNTGTGDATSLGRDDWETTMVPEFQQDICEPNGCRRVSGNVRGTGLGRLQEPADVDREFVPPDIPASRCGVSGFDAAITEEQRRELRRQGRRSVIGGGDPYANWDRNMGGARRH